APLILPAAATSQQSPPPPVRPSVSPLMPPAASSEVSAPSGPPPLPGSSPVVKSIWDEEEEYRLQAPPDSPCPQCGAAMPSHAVVCMACGYNRQMKTMTAAPTLPPQPVLKKSSPLAWANRSGQGRKMGSVKIPIVLAVV